MQEAPDLSGRGSAQSLRPTRKYVSDEESMQLGSAINLLINNRVRLEVLMDETDGVLLSSDLNGNPSSQEESPLALHLGGGAAPLTDVLRVHEWSKTAADYISI